MNGLVDYYMDGQKDDECVSGDDQVDLWMNKQMVKQRDGQMEKMVTGMGRYTYRWLKR